MRKLLLIMVVAVVTMTAKAQIYVGGELGFWRDYDANETTFKIIPEVGYKLSDKWAIGTTLGYEYLYAQGEKVNAMQVAPYARYTALSFGNVNIFFDGGFGFKTYKEDETDDSFNSWEVGIKPGLSIALNSKLNFITHFGFLGYRDTDEGSAKSWGKDGLGFDFSGNNLTFGLNYHF
jgi:hypothetical protein